MKESLIKDTTIRIGDVGNEKLPGKVIECNVNMSVSLLNVRRSRIYQRIQSLLIIFLTIIFFIVYTQIRREVGVLEAQMNSMDSNFAILMIKYERLNKNIHRINWQQSLLPKLINRQISKFDQSYSKKTIISNHNYNNNNNLLTKQQLKNIPLQHYLNPTINNNNNKNNNNDKLQINKMQLNKTDSAVISDELGKNKHENQFQYHKDDEKMVDFLKNRVIRSVVMKNAFDEHNETDTVSNSMVDKDESDLKVGKDGREMEIIGEFRTSRARRDDGRGKGQGGKSKRRPNKRSRRRLGPSVATFVGAEPEQHVTDTVYIGPWVKRNESRYGFNKFHLVEDKRSIEVTVNGLFMVSVQIYYFGQPTHYSYWVLLTSEGESSTKKVSKCATASANYATEASCFTSVILPLRRGDRLHIQQQERDRLINLREGYSFIQLTLLGNDQQKKRLGT